MALIRTLADFVWCFAGGVLAAAAFDHDTATGVWTLIAVVALDVVLALSAPVGARSTTR